ncbi:MAG: hypothetical protein ACYC63_04940 [Armatimonadota bacterium]
MPIIWDKARQTAAETAEDICARFATGYRGGVLYQGVRFELTDIAACSEFVREITEAAAQTGDHSLPYFGATARDTERLLKIHGIQVSAPDRGVIACFNAGNAGTWGHIGYCLGNGRFAENTSSKVRGPGFVISNLSDMIGRISGYYVVENLGLRVAPAAPHNPPLLIGLDQKTVCTGKLIDGNMWVPARDTVAACGLDLAWRQDQGKAYIKTQRLAKQT